MSGLSTTTSISSGHKQHLAASSQASASNSQQPAQIAADLVQSAAAKFKMLRSNTLAAASWISGTGSGENPPTTTATNSNPLAQNARHQGAPSDLLAMRTRDDRIVQSLSIGPSARNRLS